MLKSAVPKNLQRYLQKREEQLVLREELQSRGLRSMEGASGLYWWNLINILVASLPLVMPPIGFLASNLRYLMLSVVLCVAVSWFRLRGRLRMNWAIGLILGLQVWLTVCSFISGTMLGRTNDFETSNYFLVMLVMFFFQGVLFSQLWPNLRQILMNWMLILFGISAFVGVLQFLRIGPAIQLSLIYNSLGSIENWGGVTSIRAIGLAGWPEWLAVECLLGWGILASRLFSRSLKGWEYTLSLFFLFTAYTPQSRVMYISVLAATVAYIFMLVKYDKKRAAPFVSILLIGILALFTFGQSQMGYVLSTDVQNDQTLKYRQETGWRQAYEIYEDLPWTGIGPDNDLVWEIRQTIPDKYTQGEFLDNGWLLLISWGGLIAVAFLPFIIMAGVVGTSLVWNKRENSPLRRETAFTLMVGIVCIANNSMLNNGFTNIWLNCLLGYLGGMCHPTVWEVRSEVKSMFARSGLNKKPLPASSGQ